MKQRLLYTLGIIVALGLVAFAPSPTNAQTTSPGPYYATPSWDQQLPAATRFIVLSNWGSAAVLDRETGLVWEKSPSTTTFPWLSTTFSTTAAEYCNLLTVGNRRGWRLPTIQELASLVDPSVPPNGPQLPAGHPFSNVGSLQSIFWSATTNANDVSQAWVVGFSGVAGFLGTKSANHLVWCVRGGQGVDPQ